MSNIGPVPAACDAIAAFFARKIPALRGLRGWPEHDDLLDLGNPDDGVKAVLSVFAGERPSSTIRRVPPRKVDQTDIAGGPQVCILYRVAWIEFDVQLDLWAPHRAVRDEFAALVEVASVDRLPVSPDFRAFATGHFERSGYFDRPIDCVLLGSAIVDNDGAVESGEWRQTWNAHVWMDLVVPTDRFTKITSIDIETTITDQGVSVTEPITTVS